MAILDEKSGLADPKLSGFVNGMELRVDGGWLADGSWDRLRLQHRNVT